jgi:hypothetical protein
VSVLQRIQRLWQLSGSHLRALPSARAVTDIVRLSFSTAIRIDLLTIASLMTTVASSLIPGAATRRSQREDATATDYWDARLQRYAVVARRD